jgi:hypothetical protein
VAIAVLQRTVPRIDRALLVRAPRSILVARDVVMRGMAPWRVSIVHPARRVARQCAEARVADPATPVAWLRRAQQDTARGRARIEQAPGVPAALVARPRSVEQDTAPGRMRIDRAPVLPAALVARLRWVE